MREDESADGGSDTPSSADDFSDEHLQDLRDEAIRTLDGGGSAGDSGDDGLILPDDRKGGRQPTDIDAVNSDAPDHAKRNKSLGDHSATESMSASETRELIDAVSSENGHMSGNHAPKRDPAPNAFHGFERGKSPGAGSLDRSDVTEDAEAPNYFETRAATRIGDKNDRYSKSGSDGLNGSGGNGWSDAAAPLDDRADPAGSLDTEGMNRSVDYERLARHNDGRSGAWSSGGGESYSEWSAQQDKTWITENYCTRLELTPLQKQRVLGIMGRVDFQKFGRENSLEKVSLAAINHVVPIDHASRYREGDEDPLVRDFRELRKGVDMSQRQLKEFTEKVREQL